MEPRVTSRMMTDSALRNINAHLSGMNKAQTSIASGRRYQRLSDNVPAANRELGLRSSLAASSQALRNAEDGAMWVDLADSRLGSLVDSLQRARELVASGASSTNGSTARSGMATKISQIREAFVAGANARHRGRPLFSGTAGVDAVARVGANWVYQGDGGAVLRRISETERVAVNVDGGEAFGFNASEDVFTVLDQAATAVQNGDRAGMQASLDAIDRSIDRLISARTRLGATGNRIESAIFRGQADEVAMRTELSSVADTDMVEAGTELRMQEFAYQAAQGALARTLQPSLVAFLR